MARVDIRKKLDSEIAWLRQLFQPIREHSDSYDYLNVPNVLLRLHDTIRSVGDKIPDKHGKKDIILRRCDKAEVAIENLKKAVRPLRNKPDRLSSPDLWMDIIEAFQVVFDECNSVSNLLADVEQEKGEQAELKNIESNSGYGNKDFLLNIAEKIDDLVNKPEYIGIFRKQIKAFYDLLQKARSQLKSRYKQRITNKEAPHNVLEPPLFDSLMDLLSISFNLHIEELAELMCPPEENAIAQEAKSQADYVILTIIHDKRLKSPRVPEISKGIWPKDEDWINNVWDDIKKRAYTEDGQTDIRSTYKRVNADLERLEKLDQIETIEQFAIHNKEWADRNTKLKRNYTGLFGGSKKTIHDIIIFLLVKSPSVAKQVEKEWNDIIIISKEIDQLTMAVSKTTFETANSRLGSLRHSVYMLADTLTDTAKYLKSEKSKEKGKNLKSAMREAQPLLISAKNFAAEFERMASEFEDGDFSETAGSFVSMALDAGLFAEYKTELLIEYQHGLTKSKREGWIELWQKLTEILRLRRGLSILDGTFSENCQLVAAELKREAAELKAINMEYGEGVQDDVIKKAYIKKGKKWEFGYGSKQVFIDGKLKGLAIMEYLLLHKNDEYTPLELLKAVGQREKSETESEKIYSPKDIQEAQKAIKGLEGRLAESRDSQEKERLEQQIEKSKRELHKARNRTGKSRKISERYTKSVSRNINTVLNKISIQNIELYNHLNTFLRRGEICSYKPDTSISWEIS